MTLVLNASDFVVSIYRSLRRRHHKNAGLDPHPCLFLVRQAPLGLRLLARGEFDLFGFDSDVFPTNEGKWEFNIVDG
jgi:hypothetical protein